MTGSNSALLLIAAAAGYFVLERASAHKGAIKRAGQIIGWGIVLIAAAGIICQALACGSGEWPYKKSGWCPMGAHSGMSMMPMAPEHPMAVPRDAREQDAR